MPAYSLTRRSTRHVGKVVNYNKQGELIDRQVKEAARIDKKKYLSDWKKKEKAIDDYIRSLSKPEKPPVVKQLHEYKWEDQYESMEAFRDDIAKVVQLSEDNAQTVNECLEKAKTEPAQMTYLAYFTKHALLQAEDDKNFWDREFKRREQEAKDVAHWTPERREKLTNKMNDLIEEDFSIADIILRIVVSTSKMNITDGLSADDLPHVTLYKLSEYADYARKKITNKRKKKR